LPFPARKPLGWMFTTTGSGPAAGWDGSVTLRNRQFSLPARLAAVPWTHSLPNWVACSTDVHRACGWGGCQRSLPTGGAAYGMPSHSRAPPVTIPHTGPDAVETSVPSAQAAAAWVEALAEASAGTTAALTASGKPSAMR
jgi:hypothetical protein